MIRAWLSRISERCAQSPLVRRSPRTHHDVASGTGRRNVRRSLVKSSPAMHPEYLKKEECPPKSAEVRGRISDLSRQGRDCDGLPAEFRRAGVAAGIVEPRLEGEMGICLAENRSHGGRFGEVSPAAFATYLVAF